MKGGKGRSPRSRLKRNRNPGKRKSRKSGEVVVNAPLDFELRKLDPNHQYLFDRGFTKETIEHFGLGYCSRGMFKERIAIPIHDADGNLVAYAGRLVDEAPGEESPKYKFPPRRQHDGKTFEFRKSQILHNVHRLERPVRDLIFVEGFPSVWWLWQNGYPNVVALMGSSMSDRQAELIVEAVAPDGRIWFVPDGDKAGEQCVQAALQPLASERWIRWVRLEEGGQPTDCSLRDLQGLLPVASSE